jgi:hypothetical protein
MINNERRFKGNRGTSDFPCMRRKDGIMSVRAPYGKVLLTAALISGCLFSGCSDSSDSFSFGEGDDYGDWYILQPKDSLAVRAILDTNGLQKLSVDGVVEVNDAMVTRINLNAKSLSKFIFCKYFDSLLTGPELNIMENDIDTLVFPDTIRQNIFIKLDDNKLQTIPDGFGHLKGTIKLSIGYNRLQTISPDIMNCSVTYLYLNENDLCSLQDSILAWIATINSNSFWRTTQLCR